jgi:tRNA-splicing ligase RtcB
MKYINEEGMLVIKSWCDNPGDGCIEQAKNLARLPFAFKQICLMPDAHQGYGMPIGGVLATKDVVIPNAVGVDVGCGMIAVKTSLLDISIDSLKSILGEIRKRIPLGCNKHKEPQYEGLMPIHKQFVDSIVSKEYTNARKSLGTLGSGNHFIEIQKGDDNHIWIMVHSGSRNLGKQVADFYNKKAIEINEKYFSQVPKEWELAFLPLDSEEGQTYLQEMQYCVDFALANRSLMMERIQLCFLDTVDDVSFEPMINIAHNYAATENHFGKNVMVHRKGATLARENTIGIIPGSQGTSSYIVKGKGNPDSFMSCSHGAGRAMGRKQAERTLNLVEEQKRLNDKGILHSIRGVHDLDEASGAYKNIQIVMDEQSDLVDILVKLEPLAVIKG